MDVSDGLNNPIRMPSETTLFICTELSCADKGRRKPVLFVKRKSLI